MNKFNWDLIDKPSTVVYCETKEQAMELLTEAHNNGCKWFGGDVFENKTCYYIFGKSYDNIEYFKKQNYKILKFEECKLMNKLLDVDFIIQKDNKTIVLDIKHMDESLRKGNVSILAESNDGEYKILSNSKPCIGFHRLFLKGEYKNCDNDFVYHTFDSTEEMNEYIKNINKLINKINNPVIEIDINKNRTLNLKSGEIFDIYAYKNYTGISFNDEARVIKIWYVDVNEKYGQPFDEVVEEFDNFCKRRNINAKLVR